MIKNVLIDLDDTIFDFKSCERQALSCALRSFNIPFEDTNLDRYSYINDCMWKMLERGEITREKLRVHRFEVFLEEMGVRVSAEEFADRYMSSLAKTDVLIPGARELLAFLSLNYRLYAVTNGYIKTQKGRINASKIGDYFDAIFISQEIGFVKPSFEFFEFCRRKTGFLKEETVLIGDSLTSDIIGGNHYGLYTIWYNADYRNCGDVLPNAEVHSLSELQAFMRSFH